MDVSRSVKHKLDLFKRLSSILGGEIDDEIEKFEEEFGVIVSDVVSQCKPGDCVYKEKLDRAIAISGINRNISIALYENIKHLKINSGSSSEDCLDSDDTDYNAINRDKHRKIEPGRAPINGTKKAGNKIRCKTIDRVTSKEENKTRSKAGNKTGSKADTKSIAKTGRLKSMEAVQVTIEDLLKDVPQKYHAIVREIDGIHASYVRENVAQKLIDTDYKRCPGCGCTMIVSGDGSEMQCMNCACIYDVSCAIFEDVLNPNQDAPRPKMTQTKPNRHLHNWWIHILAMEPEEEIGDNKNPADVRGELLVNQMRKLIKDSKIILRTLTVSDTRDILRKMGRTNLNRNVSLLMKKITGIGPPVPNENLYKIVETLFNIAAEVGSTIPRPDGKSRSNRDYYPYYIMKILDAILPDSDIYHRRILYYIHIQKGDTLAADDKHWECICNRMPGITYNPTDRNKFKKYGQDFIRGDAGRLSYLYSSDNTTMQLIGRDQSFFRYTQANLTLPLALRSEVSTFFSFASISESPACTPSSCFDEFDVGYSEETFPSSSSECSEL